jgi:hypothetical protein
MGIPSSLACWRAGTYVSLHKYCKNQKTLEH